MKHSILNVFTINLILLLLVSSCHKKVSSDFKLDKYEYVQGEMIEITSINLKEKKQIWEIVDPFGEIVDSKQESAPQFLLNILAENGLYTINVYDNEKEKEKDVKKSKNFLVKSQKGELYIHCTNFADDNFTTYIDGQFLGESSEEVTYLLPVGPRYVEVYGRFDTIREVVNITEANSYSIWF